MRRHQDEHRQQLQTLLQKPHSRKLALVAKTRMFLSGNVTHYQSTTLPVPPALAQEQVGAQILVQPHRMTEIPGQTHPVLDLKHMSACWLFRKRLYRAMWKRQAIDDRPGACFVRQASRD